MKDYELIEEMLEEVAKASNYKETLAWVEKFAVAKDMRLDLDCKDYGRTVLRVKSMYNERNVDFQLLYGASYGYRISMTWDDDVMSDFAEVKTYSTIPTVDGLMIWNAMMELYQDTFGTRY